MARIRGGSGNDRIEGYEGDDRIEGLGGDDRLFGLGGLDKLYGGDGNDVVDGGLGADELFGENGDDVLVAYREDLIVDGGAGTDHAHLDFSGIEQALTIRAGVDGIAGNTRIRGVEQLTVRGGSGNDLLVGGGLADWIAGGEGNDVLDGGAGRDVVDGGAGDDWVGGGEGDGALMGGAGVDRAVLQYNGVAAALDFSVASNLAGAVTLRGTEISGFERVIFLSGSGDDKLAGGAMDDSLFGNAGHDQLLGGGGDDLLAGGTGDDFVSGGAGRDTIEGNDGNDLLVADAADALADGGAGIDLLSIDLQGTTGAVRFRLGVDGAIGKVQVRDVEQLSFTGGSGNDQVEGGSHSDALQGGSGNDRLAGLGGADLIDGGAGNDRVTGGLGDVSLSGGAGVDQGVLEFLGHAERIDFSVAANLAGEVMVAGTRVSGFERVQFVSGGHNDSVFGGDGADVLHGMGGHDTLAGGGGNDELHGGVGQDSLSGEGGRDKMYGGDDDDSLAGDMGDAVIDGGAGTDYAILDFHRSRAAIDFRAGEDATLGHTEVRGIERVTFFAGSGDDRITGGALGDAIYGYAGDDVIDGVWGGDTLDGGDGDDRVVGHRGDLAWHGGNGTDTLQADLTGHTGAVDFDVYSNRVGTVSVAGTAMSGFEAIAFTAGSGNDRIVGGGLADQINGGEGNDLLFGDNGADVLVGGYGDDRIVGGRGDDGVYGGMGTDTMVLGGRRADYRIERIDDNTIRTTDLRADGDGVDTLLSVERFSFADGEFTAEQLFEVNDAPVAMADAASVGEDGSVALNVLANDTDPDAGDTRTLVSVQPQGRIATLSSTPGGEVGFTPGAAFQYLAAGQSVVETATYVVRDAAGLASTGTISFTITGANDGPTGVDDRTSVDEDSAIRYLNVLGNDLDPDQGTVLSVGGIGLGGTKGTVTANADGSINYDPGQAFQHLKEGETATDSFTYSLRDGHGGVSNATVTVTIVGRDAATPEGPVASDDAIAMRGDQYAVELDGLLANDQGEGLVITDVSHYSTAGARLHLLDDGTVIYDPRFKHEEIPEGETATDSFTYTVTDAAGRTSTATAEITITGTTYSLFLKSVAEDATSENLHGRLMDVAENYWGSGLTLVSVDGEGSVGTVSWNAGAQDLRFSADHDWYDPMVPYSATQYTSFRFTIADAEGDEHVGSILIGVYGVDNDGFASAPMSAFGADAAPEAIWTGAFTDTAFIPIL